VLVAFIINATSYTLVFTIGKIFYVGDISMYLAICVAIGSPNAVSFPILVMETMCEQADINHDYDHDSQKCFDAASSMLFVYSIGWHIMFWTYAYPLLESLGNDDLSNNTLQYSADPSHNTLTFQSIIASMYTVKEFIRTDAGKKELFKWIFNVLLSPAMVSIYLGIFIGLIPALKHNIFQNGAPLHPIGSVLKTIGEPLVCINTFIMAASLAHADWRKKKDIPSSEVHSPLHLEDIHDVEIISPVIGDTNTIVVSLDDRIQDQDDLPSIRVVVMHTLFR